MSDTFRKRKYRAMKRLLKEDAFKNNTNCEESIEKGKADEELRNVLFFQGDQNLVHQFPEQN